MQQHKQQPKIVIGKTRKLIGKKLKMSLANDRTSELWRSFMPQRMKVANKVSDDLISMQVYPHSLDIGNTTQEFEKWAVLEVSHLEDIPDGMESFILNGGVYAVFDHKGLNTDTSIFTYIFKEWLPNSDYELDERPHFEILGAKYKNGDPQSEEEIWIPVSIKL
jgi:AraC family transcriptional regulator